MGIKKYATKSMPVVKLLNKDEELKQVLKEEKNVGNQALFRWCSAQLLPPLDILKFIAEIKETNIAQLLGQTKLCSTWERLTPADRRLGKILEERGIGKTAFAREISADPKQMKRYCERPLWTPEGDNEAAKERAIQRTNTLLAVAKGLGVSCDYLLGFTDFETWEEYDAFMHPLNYIEPGSPIYVVPRTKVMECNDLGKLIRDNAGYCALYSKEGDKVILPNESVMTKEKLNSIDAYVYNLYDLTK